MYNLCSRDVESCSALYAVSGRETSGHAVLVCVRAPKTVSLGSWDIYSLARRGESRGVAVYDSF